MARRLDKRQILLLNNLMYLDRRIVESPYVSRENAAIGLALGTYADGVPLASIPDDAVGGGLINGAAWRSMLRMIRADQELRQVILMDTYADDRGASAAVFFDPGANEAVVTFKGTGDYEWPDNFKSGGAITTQQQDKALAWFQGKAEGEQGLLLDLAGYRFVTVTGHSKGGNKAKYIAIMDDSVDRCLSFNGQGFSDEFLETFGDQVTLNQVKIENHNTDRDFIGILLNPVGNTTYYKGFGTEGFFWKNHSACSFFDFNHGSRMLITEQSPSMRELDLFINAYLRSMNRDSKEDVLAAISQLAEMAARDDHMGGIDYVKWILQPGQMGRSSQLAKFSVEYGLRRLGMEELKNAVGKASKRVMAWIEPEE